MQALLAPQPATVGADESRLPGETRQEWRRRMRELGAQEPQQEPSFDKFRVALRAQKEAKHAGDPWRHQRARGTWSVQ